MSRERRGEFAKQKPPPTPVLIDEPTADVVDRAQNVRIPSHIRDRIVADVQSALNARTTDVLFNTAEQVEWPDGSLGCPQPGMEYTQAIVPGYRIEVAVHGEVMDYRASNDGFVVRCESRRPATLRPKAGDLPAAEKTQ